MPFTNPVNACSIRMTLHQHLSRAAPPRLQVLRDRPPRNPAGRKGEDVNDGIIIHPRSLDGMMISVLFFTKSQPDNNNNTPSVRELTGKKKCI